MLRNTGMFFYATGAFYTARRFFVEALHYESDLKRMERLLGIKFQDVDSIKTGNEELQPLAIATINIKKMALSAIEINRKRREKEKSSTGGNKADVSRNDSINSAQERLSLNHERHPGETSL